MLKEIFATIVLGLAILTLGAAGGYLVADTTQDPPPDCTLTCESQVNTCECPAQKTLTCPVVKEKDCFTEVKNSLKQQDKWKTDVKELMN